MAHCAMAAIKEMHLDTVKLACSQRGRVVENCRSLLLPFIDNLGSVEKKANTIIRR